MSRHLPLVVILGATGSGKTKLSLELAKRFKGEIIGADSMQVYKSLDIITAKATKQEQSMAPHHLIDIIEPHEIFTVVDYRNRAVKIIDDLFQQEKLPIIVGGTNYYIESILWKILIEPVDSNVEFTPNHTIHNLHELPSVELHEKLKILDPNMARRLHPNNKRKILRSLEVLYQKGKRHSEILAEQQKSGASQSGGGLRYNNALIFRLECDKSILDERLNKRVDLMIEQGLVNELLNFHKTYNNKLVPDYTKGIFQSIGFKEFHDYLMMTDEERENNGEILAKCIEQLKLVTRRYARKQNKWTTNRFLGRIDRQVPPMFALNVDDLSKWDEMVLVPAVEIIDNYLLTKSVIGKFQPIPKQLVNSTSNAEDDTFICDVCERTFIGLFQWETHLQSHRHRKMLTRKNKMKVS